MLEIQNLSFSRGQSRILHQVQARTERSRILGIVGPNGAGKTTLIKCLLGILSPSQGQILLDGRDLSGLTRRELARRLAYVPQSQGPAFPLTVFETVLMGRRPHMAWRPSEHDLVRTGEVIQALKLTDLAHRDMDRLSGGQAQKVFLARALAQEPEYLVLDEPTSNLDLCHQLEVMEMIAGLVNDRRMGAIIALHDLNLAARFCNELLMLKNGRVFGLGPPLQLIQPDNIREVYGVEAIVYRENGYALVHALRCASHPAARAKEACLH